MLRKGGEMEGRKGFSKSIFYISAVILLLHRYLIKGERRGKGGGKSVD